VAAFAVVAVVLVLVVRKWQVNPSWFHLFPCSRNSGIPKKDLRLVSMAYLPIVPPAGVLRHWL
jgi:hypothetical protein